MTDINIKNIHNLEYYIMFVLYLHPALILKNHYQGLKNQNINSCIYFFLIYLK